MGGKMDLGSGAAWLVTRLRDLALVGAGVANLGAVVFVICIVAEPRWATPAVQLDVLKLLGIILGLTNAVVVIALASVKVHGTGPGGFSFNVDSDKDDNGSAEVHVVADVAVKPKESA